MPGTLCFVFWTVLTPNHSFAQKVAYLIGFSAALCVFCGLRVEMTIKRRESRDTQRTAEKTPRKIHFLRKAFNHTRLEFQKVRQTQITKNKVQSSKLCLQRYSDTHNSIVFLVDINLRVATQSRRSLGYGVRTKRSNSVMAVAALYLHLRTRSRPAVLNL